MELINDLSKAQDVLLSDHQIICAMHAADNHVVLGDTLKICSLASWLCARDAHMWGLHVVVRLEIGLSKENLKDKLT